MNGIIRDVTSRGRYSKTQVLYRPSLADREHINTLHRAHYLVMARQESKIESPSMEELLGPEHPHTSEVG